MRDHTERPTFRTLYSRSYSHRVRLGRDNGARFAQQLLSRCLQRLRLAQLWHELIPLHEAGKAPIGTRSEATDPFTADEDVGQRALARQLAKSTRVAEPFGPSANHLPKLHLSSATGALEERNRLRGKGRKDR